MNNNGGCAKKEQMQFVRETIGAARTGAKSMRGGMAMSGKRRVFVECQELLGRAIFVGSGVARQIKMRSSKGGTPNAVSAANRKIPKECVPSASIVSRENRGAPESCCWAMNTANVVRRNQSGGVAVEMQFAGGKQLETNSPTRAKNRKDWQARTFYSRRCRRLSQRGESNQTSGSAASSAAVCSSGVREKIWPRR